MKLIHSITLLLALLSNETTAFTNTPHTSLSRHVGTSYCNSPSSLLMAGKKRRRRKDSSTIITTPLEEDALPDFDDAEDDDNVVLSAEQAEVAAASTLSTTTSTKKSTIPIKKGTGLNPQLAEELGGNVSGLDEELILESMRGSTGGDNSNWVPPTSIRETLADRSLEKLMNFDKMIEQDGGGAGERVDLPEFDDVIARRRARLGEEDTTVGVANSSNSGGVDTTGMGKKAAKQAQRKALAIQRESQLESEKSPFEGLNILKLLENGAWVGIGLLVLWELYINSPFFERAMPLIPVVYDDVPPGM